MTVRRPLVPRRTRARSSMCSSGGTTVDLSDGDAVFQPRKVERSGLGTRSRTASSSTSTKQELADVERLFPADRYVLIDDNCVSWRR